MKFRNLPVVITFFMVVCVLAIIGASVFRSWEAEMPSPMPLALTGLEYSSDGSITWDPVGTGDALRKQRNDVAIRGHFNLDIKDGWIMNLYLHHMQMELLVNGELINSFAREFHEIRPEWCADLWVNFRLPDISTEDLVEIRLYSLHPFGAAMGTFEKVISSITMGDPFFMYQYINTQNVGEQQAGLSLMVVGIMLFGIAFVALWMKSPLQRIMMYLALFTIGEGLFWLADAAEIAHYANNSIALFSSGRYVSHILRVFALLAAIADLVSGKAKLFAQAASYTNGVLSIGYLLLNLTGVITFCGSEHIWYCTEVLLLLVGFVCCLWDLLQNKKPFWQFVRLLTLGAAFGAILFDLCTMISGWYTEMELSKWVCAAVAVIHSSAMLIRLPSSYAALRRAEELSDELHNSRIVLAMSQIRTHFIFNVLNAISSLCKSDPEQADIELVRFSRYLRNNIDIMQDDHPIPFEKALEHMHNYVDLEQLRFGDKIILDENYEYVNFTIPALVIQPLVENAIKHGLLPKAEGGIIRVKTSRQGNDVLIEISDNGIGFDTSQKIAKTSVGLNNVRFRVEKIMNGRMRVESIPGAGTFIRLWLPLGKEGSSFTLSA